MRAKPCVVTQRETWTPIEAILRGREPRGSQTPVRPVDRVASSPKGATRPDDRLLEVTDVALTSFPWRLRSRIGITDELPGAVVGRLAATVGLDDLDRGVRGDVELLRLLRAAAGRDHRGVLDQDDGLRDRSAP